MKKALNNKFFRTKKLIRRVLSKPLLDQSDESASRVITIEEPMDSQEIVLKNELDALKDQISNLKVAIQTLQNDTEQKDIYIANLAREKEKITLDLLKTKRSNVSLAKQLEDERKFYFKEKELYCHEMNEFRRLKRQWSNSSIAQNEKTIEECRHEILKLKQTLNQTLEANYNLSIKFLRMKNTKTCLKTELHAMRLEHEKNDYKTKIENLSLELNDLVNEKLNASISPSSKKYLQLVKQNGCLVYENLCLQLDVDNLNFKMEKLKCHQSKSSSNEHLKYINHKMQNRNQREKDSLKLSIYSETPEKLEKEPKPCCSKNQIEDNEIIKLFERKDGKMRKSRSNKKEEIKQKTSSTDTKNPGSDLKISIPDEYKINIDDCCRQKIAKNSSKIALFQVSNVTSTTSSSFSHPFTPNVKRIRSSPDILESVDFIKKP
ncbi:uncharacterized protein LOC130448252 [Diorhabda sublineata]|uniref:uncharacterized protein LOC130448252 n=1 Tax=Diorhabda sublineata TaxID=1163346 RepID=UPI0024E0DE1B|nr:uncharacterized protein LOC130448252 [Diorhabda sublineata]